VVQGAPDQLKDGLEGDTIEVELAEAQSGRARAALEDIAGLGRISLAGSTLRAAARDGAAAIPAVLGALDRNGIRANSVRLARPTLDDVYLRYAGRAFRHAELEQTEVAA
jgi:ABC-2 type transport system ATP-binding protein